MQPAPDVWQPLIEYVLPRSLLDTTLLLGGVGALSLALGTGTAWAISLHEFRGRQMLLWLLPPLQRELQVTVVVMAAVPMLGIYPILAQKKVSTQTWSNVFHPSRNTRS